MKAIAIAAILLAGLPVAAQAAKPCEELKSEIAAKIDAKGVPQYTLTIMPAADVGDQKVVGSCNGGQDRITYLRGAAASVPAEAPAAPAAEPEAAPAPPAP